MEVCIEVLSQSWSPVEKTALAEAEIEYKDILPKSIYVPFKIIESHKRTN